MMKFDTHELRGPSVHKSRFVDELIRLLRYFNLNVAVLPDIKPWDPLGGLGLSSRHWGSLQGKRRIGRDPQPESVTLYST